MVTVDNPQGNGKSTIPCLLERDHAGDHDPQFRMPGAIPETLDPAPDAEPSTISPDTFSLDDFVARCVKLHPKRGDFVFVSIPQLTHLELAPIAKQLVDLFGSLGAQCIVSNKRFDVLDEASMAEYGWYRKP
jgi:hypothetical protein